MAARRTSVRCLLPVETQEQQAAADAIGKRLKALGYVPVRVAGDLPEGVIYLYLSEICEVFGIPMRPEYEGAYITVREP